MLTQIEKDSEYLFDSLATYIASYANALEPSELKKLSLALQVLLSKKPADD